MVCNRRAAASLTCSVGGVAARLRA